MHGFETYVYVLCIYLHINKSLWSSFTFEIPVLHFVWVCPFLKSGKLERELLDNDLDYKHQASVCFFATLPLFC